ncbi:flagellar basal-body MS-ring/collar protein FliF [Sporosarcina jiandibaonis]|uniref:flagellar basal-body MS-ring/collar protein FliF n=1 Tax=Sporosarcina jiandibaonis TaxID=2715535 RepID=UPI0015575409|nr:flagellar basal-body MS-ring/collar protein FliF [Sporosarcina jiandibaonis]
MKEKLIYYKNKIIDSNSWGKIPSKTKWILISSFFLTILLIFVLVFFSSRSNFVALYSNLTPSEAGEIKTAIEEKGIPVQISTDGKTLSVPNEELANLKVGLAAEGIPKNGNVNYSIFSENMGLGMTDRHFDVVERDAMQNELAYLIRQISGVTDANVMITLPKENIWITDTDQAATASVIVKSEPSFQLDQKQINGLYYLISKSVPNLHTEQIVIMDQNGQVFEMQEENQLDTSLSLYQQQREIKKGIEQDIQRELQQMLGLLLGRDKVVVSVMASVDFTKEKREEELVEPVDLENNQGIEISVERIIESFSGEGSTGDTGTGTGEGEIANYPGEGESGSSDSERTEERINREVNRIHRQIELSPYVIDDITINVGVEPPTPDNLASLTQQNINDISNLLKNAVSTSLSMNGAEVTEMDLDDRISVFATEFQGKPDLDIEKPNDTLLNINDLSINIWMLIAAGAALAIIVLSIILFIRKKKRDRLEEELSLNMYEQTPFPGLEDEEEEIDLSDFNKTNPKRKTIEKLAKERPEDFAKLLRTWMSED